MDSEIVILIPVYNPREEIINYIEELKKERYSIVVVNDGSDEKYHSLFEKIVDDCIIINYPVSKGKGYALKKGYIYIKEYLYHKKGIIALEQEYSIKRLNQLSDLMKKNKETFYFVHQKGKRILSKIFSLIYHQDVMNVDSPILGIPMPYLNQMIHIDEQCYEVQTLIECVQKNNKIEEIIIENKNSNQFHQKNKLSQVLYVIFLHFFRFVSSSLISSAIDVILAWILLDVLKIWMTSDFWRIAIASLVARIISTIENYIYNKKIVFKERTESKQTGRRFLILTVVITILSTLFVYVFSTLGIMSEKLAKPVGDLLLFLLSYNVQMKWVFSKE